MSKHLKRRRATAAVATLATLGASGTLAASVFTASPAAAAAGGPTVTITPITAGPTNAGPLQFRVAFSTNVLRDTLAGFQASDVVVSGGTATVTRTAISPQTIFGVVYDNEFLVSLSPTSGSGTYGISVLADQAFGDIDPTVLGVDIRGNQPSNAASVVYDITKPDVGLVRTTIGDPTNASPIVFTATFSEPVNALTAAGVNVTNGTVASVVPVSSSVYTINVTPTADGPVTVQLPNGATTDPAGNISNNSVLLTVASDRTRPDVATFNRVGPNTSPTNAASVTYNAVFDEVVTGFATGDVIVTNGTATVSGSGTTYTVVVTPTADGAVTVRIPANIAVDAAGNLNRQGPLRSFVSDKTAPVITAPDVTVDATGVTTPVTFAPTATDAIDGAVAVTCDRLSGSSFPLGTTTVNCSATDAAGNTATDSFDVTVNIADTVLVANPLVIQSGKGTTNVLTATLTRADNGAPIAGAPIRFVIGDGSPALPFTTVCAAKVTDSNGVATCKPDAKELKAASLNGSFTASYAGNAFLQAESDQGPITS